jgi:catalase
LVSAAVSPRSAQVKKKNSTKEIVERTLASTRSVEYDALVIADGTGGLKDIKLTVLLQEMFRHCKAIGAWGNGAQVLEAAGIDVSAPGILLHDTLTKQHISELLETIGLHRVWERAELVMSQ